jgi:hypothetical protein
LTPARVKKRRGIALLVASNRLNPRHYGKWTPACPSAVADVKLMSGMTKARRYENRTLVGTQATARRLRAALHRAAKELGDGDVFLLYYAGHGATVIDISHQLKHGKLGVTEPERRLMLSNLKKKQMKFAAGWALHDRIFLNDEFDEPMGRFAEGVKIIVVVDSCFSGDSFLGPRPFSGTFPKRVRQSYDRSSRRMPPLQVLRVYIRHQDRYNDIQEKAIAAKRKSHPLRAGGVLLAACRGREEAHNYYVEHDAGFFTEALLQELFDGRLSDYRTLMKRTTKRVHRAKKTQHPIYRRFGAATTLIDELSPFTVNLH